MRSASTASMSDASSASSSALRGAARAPTATAGVWQKPPVRTPGRQKRASSRAITRSHEAASCAPPATHAPLTAATLTCGTSASSALTSAHISSTRRCSAAGASWKSLKSCPELKTGPVPSRRRVRTSGSGPPCVTSMAAHAPKKLWSLARRAAVSGLRRLASTSRRLATPSHETHMQRPGVALSTDLTAMPCASECLGR
mmetsp:Transcript_44428/g.144216  ORF Transcript_44428/g.144216 Transcript_44428/m.144216 type:complete len:200 (+) Transcript_44428:335-934(+)